MGPEGCQDFTPKSLIKKEKEMRSTSICIGKRKPARQWVDKEVGKAGNGSRCAREARVLSGSVDELGGLGEFL